MAKKEEKIKLHRDYNLEEDYYKEEKDEDIEQTQESINKKNQYELGALNNKKEQDKILQSITKSHIVEKKLSKNSKFDLLVRIILISAALIFIPLSYMVTNNFGEIENNIIFFNIKNLISREYLTNKSPTNIFFYIKIIQNKDFMSGLSSILYTIFHPYITLKTVFSTSFIFFIITVMKCINQSQRPLWKIINNNDINDIIECETSFSSPCIGIFLISFYYFYTIFCIRSFYSKDKKLSIISKIILLLFYLAINILEYIYLLFYKLNYLHEIVYTHMLTLVLLCILIDFDKKFHKKLFDSTKNIFKTRKNKLKIFIYGFAIFFSGVVAYNFILPKKILFEVIDKLAQNESCSKDQKEIFGIKATLLDISYIFSIVGAFWGVCLTIENNPGEWWYQPLIIDYSDINKSKIDNFEVPKNKIGCSTILFLIIKCILMTTVNFLLWLGFKQIPYITFEFNLMMNGIKYFCINFICFGIMPIIFGYLHLNKRVEGIYINDNMFNDIFNEDNNINKNLFAATLFVNYQEKARYPIVHLKRI